jgi:hypothetical protein
MRVLHCSGDVHRRPHVDRYRRGLDPEGKRAAFSRAPITVTPEERIASGGIVGF